MKKKLVFIAGAVLTASLVALASCGEVTTSIGANWYKDTSLSSNISGTSEKLTYKVAYDGSDAANTTYSASYADGTYTTELVNSTYTREDGTVENVYLYTTSLVIDVTFTFEGESATYTDEVTTSVIFGTADKSLKPIESVKTVSSHSPASSSAESLDETTVYYHYTFTAAYDKNVTQATLTYTKLDGDESSLEDSTRTYDIDDAYTYLDNEQILFAARGMDLGDSASETVYTLNASRGVVQPVTIENSDVLEGTFQINIDSSEMPEGGYTLTYNAVTISINETQSGSSQTCYYAETTDASNNTYRNVMLYMETTLPYSLGALTYTLTDATFTTK